MATRDDAIRIALAMPEVEVGQAWGTTDYRVRNKLFLAFTVPDRATLKLDPAFAELLIASDPETYIPHRGFFGSSGWVRAAFEQVDVDTLRELIEQSWCNVVPVRVRNAWLEMSEKFE